MSFFYDEISDAPPTQPAPYYGPEMGFFESVPAFFGVQVEAANTDAYADMLRDKMDPVIETIQERSGQAFLNPANFFGTSAEPGANDENRQYWLSKIFNEIQRNPSLYPEYADLTADKIDAEIKDEARSILKEGEMYSQRLTAAGEVGKFLGTIGGNFVDDNFFELNLLTGGTLALGRTMAQMAARGAMISATQEALLQPEVKRWRESLGLPYSTSEFFTSVIGAGILGGALPVALKGVGTGVKLTTDQIKSGIEAYRKSGLIPDNDAAALSAKLDDAEVVAQKPYPEMDDLEHLDNVQRATADVADGRLPFQEGEPRIKEEILTVPEASVENSAALAKQIDDLPDEMVTRIEFDDGGIRELSGREIKEIYKQEDAMLDRLRGCVIR
jgi:hypothetical protein